MKKAPFPAYEGDAPYIFVCYAHADAPAVYDDLEWLRHQGFNLWYGEGINGGADWRETIARKIDGAELFLYFLSPASAASPDCVRETHYAVDRDMALVIAELTPTQLQGGLRLSIASIQALHRHRLAARSYREELSGALRTHVRHSIRRLEDQTIVASDLRCFMTCARSADSAVVERLLVHYENLAESIVHEFGGVLRALEGDSFVLSFPDMHDGTRAVTEIACRWRALLATRQVETGMAVGLTIGGFSVSRSFQFGASLDVARAICALAKRGPADDVTVLVSERLLARLDPAPPTMVFGYAEPNPTAASGRVLVAGGPNPGAAPAVRQLLLPQIDS